MIDFSFVKIAEVRAARFDLGLEAHPDRGHTALRDPPSEGFRTQALSLQIRAAKGQPSMKESI